MQCNERVLDSSWQVSVPWRGRYQTESSPTDDCELDMLIHEDKQWEPRGLPMEKSLKKKRAQENEASLALLEKDFLEDPGEPRTLYYLGLHYKTAFEQHDDNTSAAALVSQLLWMQMSDLAVPCTSLCLQIIFVALLAPIRMQPDVYF
jgi:hypothetical protein